jgi:hypothetical protein
VAGPSPTIAKKLNERIAVYDVGHMQFDIETFIFFVAMCTLELDLGLLFGACIEAWLDTQDVEAPQT